VSEVHSLINSGLNVKCPLLCRLSL